MKNYVKYKDVVIEYTILYRKRKSIGISVSTKDGVKVAAPNWVGKKQIQDIVNEKAEWIFKKLDELSKRPVSTVKKEFADETEFLYMGRVLYLKLVETQDNKKASLKIAADMIIISIPRDVQGEEREVCLKKLVTNWYREGAAKILNERTDHFSKIMGVKPEHIRVKQQKTRWGSCSSRGNINFNWKLIMFPIEVIDYVVVHELAHMKVMNHSERFWKVVGEIIPDYKIRTKQLKEYARMLDFPE
jgi:predicted metal-dependent hydrolase